MSERSVRFDSAGLIPAVIQDGDTGRVLMLGYMNEESLRLTRESSRVVFWSRSRGQLWRKGDTSGNAFFVRRIDVDCDGDALLISIDPVAAACHTGAASCFDDETPAKGGAQ